jgi:indolepyruvate ferredoxin oxidoreductase, beta subunit
MGLNHFDVYLVGVGGQGVLTIGEILVVAASLQGVAVNFYPTEGMAQRGGFVMAQLRLGRALAGPNIPEKGADLVISMEVSEALKAVRFVRPGGEAVLWGHVWAPTAVMLGKAAYPALAQVEEQFRLAGAGLFTVDPVKLPCFGDAPVAANIFILGVAMGRAAMGKTRLGQVIDSGNVCQALTARWPRAAARNLFAFQAGLDLAPEVV